MSSVISPPASWSAWAGELESAFVDWLDRRASPSRELMESMGYSLLGGGKRFRPALAFATASVYRVPSSFVLPWAMAAEMIHTYSLIHDDLPCMDDDDERRGRPTNHRRFGEATALLAGDALLTDAFGLIAESYSGSGLICSRLIELLSESAGSRGMIAGQMLDLAAEARGHSRIEEVNQLHHLKTGLMIRAPVVGAGILAQVDKDELELLSRFSIELGLAFQIADDLLDSHEDKQDGRSTFHALGEKGAREELQRVSLRAQELLQKLQGPTQELAQILEFNLHRKS